MKEECPNQPQKCPLIIKVVVSESFLVEMNKSNGENFA
jgi:hypothetical protein